MRKPLALAAATMVALGAVAAAPSAQQRPEYQNEFDLQLGDTASGVGFAPVGVNVQNYVDDYTCDGAPNHTCEFALIKVTNPYEEENAKKGRERANLVVDVLPDVPVSDYDILVWESDADGTQGPQAGYGGSIQTDNEGARETANVVVTTTEDETERYYLVWIVHWSTVGSYTINVSFDQ